MKKTLAIIGNGCAAMEAVKSIRSQGSVDDIHVISDSIWPTYNPMLTTYYASGKIGFESLFPYGADTDHYDKHQVKLHQGSPVTKLDAINKTILCQNGYTLSYDKCLVASGASPVIPPIPGLVKEDILTVRTVEDAIRLKSVLESNKQSFLVVGASMVGIKIVEMLVKSNKSVVFADLADHIFPLAAHPNCSKLLENALTEKGVKLRLNSAVNKFEKNKGLYKVYYSASDTSDEVDHIIMCIGMRTNLDFIDKNQVDTKSGLIVNNHMETSCPNLYAAGDVAQGNNIITQQNQILGLWANGRYQGRTAGANMAGGNKSYYGTLPHNITHYLETDFIGIGDVSEGDRIFEMTKDGIYCRLVWKYDKLVGINLINAPEVSGILKNILIKDLQTEYDHNLNMPKVGNIIKAKLSKLFPEINNFI